MKQYKNKRVDELINVAHHKHASCNVNFCTIHYDYGPSLTHLNSICLNHINYTRTYDYLSILNGNNVNDFCKMV